MTKVFIDGSAGTTGLKIFNRLALRNDLTIITLPENLRKDPTARKNAINDSDVCFLCLPDDASRESVSLVENPNTVIIDTSTAHRVNPNFDYGFPELKGMREKIAVSKRIANPGCHASGFIALVKPLIDAGVIDSSINLSCYSLTGYTGGGKKMIAEYESDDKPFSYNSPRLYGLTQTHKHLPEMKAVCSLEKEPIFMPVVCDFDCGMQVSVPLFASDIKANVNDIKDIYKAYYTGKIVYYRDDTENGFLSSNAFCGRDDMAVSVYGNSERILLVSRFDNLGKGASGAGIQNMNIALGLDETYGLNL